MTWIIAWRFAAFRIINPWNNKKFLIISGLTSRHRNSSEGFQPVDAKNSSWQFLFIYIHYLFIYTIIYVIIYLFINIQWLILIAITVINDKVITC